MHSNAEFFINLERRLSALEDIKQRVSELETKYEHIHKSLDEPVKAITDTERLDFMEKTQSKVINYISSQKRFNIISYKYNIDTYGETLREAIDSAMRKSDGE